MAATFKILVDTLLRKATFEQTNSNTNAQTYLQTLVLGGFATVSARGGAQIVSVTCNGKTTTLAIPPGSWSESDLMAGAEYALQILEAGFTRTTTCVRAQLTDPTAPSGP